MKNLFPISNKKAIIILSSVLMVIVLVYGLIYFSKPVLDKKNINETTSEFKKDVELYSTQKPFEETSESSTSPDLPASKNQKNVPKDNQETQAENQTEEKSYNTPEEILGLYRMAVGKITEKGLADYSKKKWQTIENIDTKNKAANEIVRSFAEYYLTSEDEAKEVQYYKYTQESKENFPPCSMTDVNYLKSASCIKNGNNYDIKIVIKDQENPLKTNNHLGQITNEILYMEDVYGVLDNIKMIKSIDKTKTRLIYDDFTISCTISDKGEFINLTQYTTVNIEATGVVKLGIEYPLTVTAQFEDYTQFYNFKY